MSDFFELARSLNLLSEQTGNRLSRLRKTKLLDFAFEASFALPRRGHAENLGFEFMANTSLSGGAQPCNETTCRVNRADHLARFAALYADHVVIPNLFAEYSANFSVDVLRSRLEGDIAVMSLLEPLIQEGLVSVIPPAVAMCNACKGSFEAQRERLLNLLPKGC